jgi:hypothetical protein
VVGLVCPHKTSPQHHHKSPGFRVNHIHLLSFVTLSNPGASRGSIAQPYFGTTERTLKSVSQNLNIS